MADKQFDLEAFKAFVRSKPADEEYEQDSLKACALGQFGFSLWRDEAERAGIPGPVYEAAAWNEPATWGALASRLDALPPRA